MLRIINFNRRTGLPCLRRWLHDSKLPQVTSYKAREKKYEFVIGTESPRKADYQRSVEVYTTQYSTKEAKEYWDTNVNNGEKKEKTGVLDPSSADPNDRED